MISVEAWTTIRTLRAQGHSISAISRQLRLSRKAIRRALRNNQPPRYQRNPVENPQLVPFIPAIQQMTSEQHLIGSRILNEIRTLGYQGSAAAFYRTWTRLRPPQPDPRVTERFETAPGVQCQFDWSPYTVLFSGVLTRVIVYGCILSYSRRLFYWASLDEAQPSIYEALEEAFWHFGGVPKTALVDNAKAFVLNARPDRFAWNPTFLELCGYYCVEPQACAPRRPQTKGKCEKPFAFLEQHFIKGHTWEDFPRFCQALTRFTAEVLDPREHHTTHQPPLERFAEELPHLTPLPATRYVGIHALTRKVSWDCMVAYDGSRYSVPYVYAGKRVWLRLSQGVRLEILSPTGAALATHALSPTRGATVLDPTHYEGLRKDTPRSKVVLVEAFQARFPEQQRFLDGVLTQYKSNPVRHLRGVLELARQYPAEAMSAAFEIACAYSTYSFGFIRGVLQHQAQPLTMLPQPTGVLADVPRLAIKRDLRVYQGFLRPVVQGDRHDH
jgi:transposase